jgi:phage terminase small subunit
LFPNIFNKAQYHVDQPPLNARQIRFCEEYLIDHNATQAAIRAGYTQQNADVTGPRLLRKDGIKAYIDGKSKVLQQKVGISQERVLLEMTRIATFDPRKLYHPDGSPKQIHELDDDTAACVAGIEIEETGGGRSKKKKMRVVRMRFWSKDRQLEVLGKHFKIFDDITPVVVNQPVNINGLSAAELKALLAIKKKVAG